MRSWIAEYLSGRTATMTIGGVMKTVRVTKGCPQGSILGPILWNVTTEALLKIDFPDFVTIQAYADDIAISIAATTRETLVQRAEQTLIPVMDWAVDRGLTFSATKSQAMMTKGDLVPGFSIAFGQGRIVSVKTVKYLGLWLDPARSFKVHVEKSLCEEHALFSRLRGAVGAGWGIRRSNLMIMYRGVFLPKVAYGVRMWSHALHTRTVERKLGTLQRRALTGITGAYRSMSTAALQVLAGTPPLDLELEWLAAREDVKHLPEGLRVETLRRASTKLLDAWQSRWSTSQKGRWTHECFPDIRHRLTLPIALGHEIAQFLTGHGNFQSKLAELGLRPSPHCSCGNGNEDVRHVLYDCTIHDAHRASLELAANRAGFLWPTAMRDLVSRKDTYAALVKFAKEAAYLERPQAAD